jgi:hypothetical protein
MTTHATDAEEVDPRWWLSSQGKSEGPYSPGYVLAALKTNGIPATTHACPVGGSDWKPVGAWPIFCDAVRTSSAASSQSPASQFNSPVTNSRLPLMANLICIYAIVASPVLWVFSTSSTLVTGATYREDSRLFSIEILFQLVDGFVSLILTVLMCFGGLLLRSLRPSGVLAIKASIVANIVFGLLILVFAIGIAAIATDADMANETPAGDLMFLFSLVIGLADLAFEIVALIWLFWNFKKLPFARA